jgi:hypothetical protein
MEHGISKSVSALARGEDEEESTLPVTRFILATVQRAGKVVNTNIDKSCRLFGSGINHFPGRH